MLTKLALSLLNSPDDEHIPRAGPDGQVLFPKLDGRADEFEDPEVTLSSKLEEWENEYIQRLSGEVLMEPIEDWPLSRKGTSKIIIYVEYIKTIDYLIRVSQQQRYPTIDTAN